MAIDSRHSLYAANIEAWQRCRDASLGEDTVKAAGTKYLPKISPEQTNQAYAAYKTRAVYFEGVGRTVAGFCGAIGRRPHTIKLPGRLTPMLGDATSDGVSIDEFIKQLCAEALLIGRGGVLVDWDNESGQPYFKFYAAESIINWGDSEFRVMETVYEPDPKDALDFVAVSQIRQMHLLDGVYAATIWRRAPGPGSRWEIHEVITPSRHGIPLTSIPWCWLSSMGATNRIERPPLMGLVNVSFSHYRTSADLEHGRHFCGMPTLWITGASDDGAPVQVGAGAVIRLADPASRVGYAEFTGQGLGSLQDALTEKRDFMSALGGAVFAGQRKGIEAAETARIHSSGEVNLLLGIVSAVEQVLRQAFAFAAEWFVNVDSNGISVSLNRDLVDSKLDPQTLVGLVGAWQAGGLPLESFLYCLQQGDLLDPTVSIIDEAARLRTAAERAGRS